MTGLTKFSVGDEVLAYSNEQWRPGTIIGVTSEDRPIVRWADGTEASRSESDLIAKPAPTWVQEGIYVRRMVGTGVIARGKEIETHDVGFTITGPDGTAEKDLVATAEKLCALLNTKELEL